MKSLVSIFLLLGSLVCLTLGTENLCQISASNVNSRSHGVFLNQDGDDYFIKSPSSGLFQWDKNQAVVIGCPNGIRSTNCESSSTRISTTCSPSLGPAAKVTSKSCGKSEEGRVIQLGYPYGSKDKVSISYTLCFNVKKCSVLYSRHSLAGANFLPKNLSYVAPTTRNGGVCSTTIDYFYANSWQERNRNALGLTRGHLYQRAPMVPAIDHPVYSWKTFTNVYVNGAPGWDSVVQGNWAKVTEQVNALARRTKQSYVVYSGVVYPNQDRFLDRNTNTIKIPQWFWKAVSGSRNGVVFFVLNNILASREEKAKKFCPQDLCEVLGWRFDKDESKGLVRCCNFEGEVTKIVPEDARFSNLLQQNE
ncbi:uncharacterized protein LOC129758095 [Uranotaenia lowii]|uniref:uncharacterized protein LOC129758095 n=1 Tax=Uranotaenia lowii TaxID=190385 RepID=UPI00247A1C2D|nr:uncharacterized protein LOC129758095 [Uranotaenia lowii]